MEMCVNSNFMELDDCLLLDIDGGTVWGVLGGIATVVAGVATIVGGAALCCVPEPTTATKFGGVSCIIAGAGLVLAGSAQVGSSW